MRTDTAARDTNIRKFASSAGLTRNIPGLKMAFTFLREVAGSPRSVGAICSSSPWLSECIARHVDVTKNGYVLELGGGTGAITTSLLRRGVHPDRLVVLEKSARFAFHLKNRFPKVRVVEGDACRVEELFSGLGSFGTIVSGLPLHSLDTDAVARITAGCASLLSHDGQLLQFTYAMMARSPWVQAKLQRIASETVLLNMPPARVDVFKHSNPTR
jgi:phospholipid N-methyltransferase